MRIGVFLYIAVAEFQIPRNFMGKHFLCGNLLGNVIICGFQVLLTHLRVQSQCGCTRPLARQMASNNHAPE